MPKEHQTIFGTTEKSNFILNMKLDTMYKIVRIFILISMVLSVLGGIIWLSTGHVNAYLGLAFLIGSAFFSALWFGISVWKSSTPFYKNKSYFIIIALAVLTILSTLDSWSIVTSFFGHQGRFEGMLALISYMCLFLLASLIYGEKNSRVVFDVMISVGVVNSLIGILQRIGAVTAPFKDVNIVENLYIPSGLVGSPIFLATMLVLFNGIALMGACSDNNGTRRVCYGISAALFTVVAFLTHSLIGLIGIPLTYIAVLVFTAVKYFRSCKEKGIKPFVKFASDFRFIVKLNVNEPNNLPLARSLALTSIFLIVPAIAVLCVSPALFSPLDREIAWHDGFYYLAVSGTLANSYEGGLYETGWMSAINIITDFNADTHYWLFGTGPDCMYFPRSLENEYRNISMVLNSLDKAYNDYLYTAATRGIPVLLLYISLIVLSLKNSFGNIKNFFEKKDNWYLPAILISVVAYLLVMFIGVSTIYVAPFFWILLGMMNTKEPVVNNGDGKPAKAVNAEAKSPASTSSKKTKKKKK